MSEFIGKGSVFGWFDGLVMPLQDIFVALSALDRPSPNIFFLTVNNLTLFVSIAQQAEGVCTLSAQSFFWRRNPTKRLGFLLPWISP
jgi:hypothetical protein